MGKTKITWILALCKDAGLEMGTTGRQREKTQPVQLPRHWDLEEGGQLQFVVSGRNAFPARLATAYRGLFPAGHAHQMEL